MAVAPKAAAETAMVEKRILIVVLCCEKKGIISLRKIKVGRVEIKVVKELFLKSVGGLLKE